MWLLGVLLQFAHLNCTPSWPISKALELKNFRKVKKQEA